MRTVSEKNPIAMSELREMAEGRFGDLVKAVVDLERDVMLVDAEMQPAIRDRISDLVRRLVRR